MKIYKFGGASVKDAEGVKNMAHVLEITGNQDTLIVVSAMGKTTNALERLIQDYLNGNSFQTGFRALQDYHYHIVEKLFPDKALVWNRLQYFFEKLENFLSHNKSTKYDYVYDQVVCYGELLSTTIISEYLNSLGLKNQWKDARKYIKTDSTFRDAQVQWDETQEQISEGLQKGILYITQGFIGSDSNNFTTTLGREGSDYSAAIFGYCLNATEVTIWKDVAGVLNADPRVFDKTELLEQISYEEAIELAFYGASVIHPKTLQPLQRKEIPLYVRSFIHPVETGTAVRKGQPLFPKMACFIVKKDLVLISLSTLDFSFMVEENLSEIFRLFHKYQMKVDLIQNSAISFSVCVDNKFSNLEKLINHLKARFKVDFKPGVSLYTIRHFNDAAIKELEEGKEILLKQLTPETLQIVTKS